MTAHVIRVDITETATGLTVRYPDEPAEPRLVAPSDVEEIEARVHELSEAEKIWESKSDRLRGIRFDLGQRLFTLLDGPARRLTRGLAEARAADMPPHLVLRIQKNAVGDTSPPQVLRWRWVTLCAPDSGPLFADSAITSPRLTLQLGPAELDDAKSLPTRCLRVLFMASSPLATEPILDFENEEERLLAAVAPFVDDGRVSFDVVEDGTLEALRERLQKDAYDVVVLSSHGLRTDTGPRLVLEDAEGARKDATPEDLLEAFGTAVHKPALVILSSCHSADSHGASESPSMVTALVAGGIPAALGWQRPVLDTVATELGHDLIAHLAQGAALPEAVAYARSRLVAARVARDPSRHAWATMQLVSRSALGFRLDAEAASAPPIVSRDALYRWLGESGQMQVLQQGFVGRRRELQRLLRILRTGEDASKPVAGALIWGNKGQGKSCLAARALDRHTHTFGESPDGVGVVVIHGVIDAVRVLAAFQRLAETWDDDIALARLASADDGAFVRLRRLLLSHWKRRRVVVVLDDFEQNLTLDARGDALVSADAAALLEALVPPCRSGRPKLLLTCTSNFPLDGLPGTLAVIELGPLEQSAVKKLWFRGREAELSRISPDEWASLAERLGRNARVLAWARSLLSGKTPDEFLSIVEEAKEELPEFGDLVNEEQHSRLAEMFLRTLAFRQLGARSADVDTFLKRARVYETLVPAGAFAGLCDDLDVEPRRDFVGLANLGLLEVGRASDERVWRVSPLIEAEFSAEEPARWHEVAAEFWAGRVEGGGVEAVHRAWSHALAAGREDIATPMCPHLDYWLWRRGLYQENWKLAQRHIAVFPEGFHGLFWAGKSARYVGDLFASRKYLEDAGARLDPAHVDDQLRVVFLSFFAKTLHAQGDLNGARALLERCRAISETNHGTDEHPEVFAILHDLAAVLLAQGDLNGARALLERCKEIMQTIHGTDQHPGVAVILHELGRVLLAQGDLNGARARLEQSLEVHRHVLGNDSLPVVAVSLHALADVLLAQGDLDGARSRLERSLQLLRTIHGTDQHPQVACSLNTLAGVLYAQGNLKSARALLERSLEILRAIYESDEHPDVSATLHGLARVLKAQGDLGRARALLDQSLRIAQSVHGSDKHPDVAASLHVMGGVLQAQGDLSGARAYLERSLEIKRAIHGTDNHPLVAGSLHELAGILQAQGDLRGARALLDYSLEINKTIHGTNDHPDFATGLDGLAALEAAEGNVPKAIATLEHSLDIREHLFGTTTHYMYAESEANLAMLLFRDGRQEEAVRRLHHALSVLRVQAPNHPSLGRLQAMTGLLPLGERVSEWRDSGASAED